LQQRPKTKNILHKIPKLVEAYAWSQPDRGKELTEQIAAGLELQYPEISKGLRRFVDKGIKPMRLGAIPQKIISFEEPEHGFDTVILSDTVLAECKSIVAEHAMSQRLAEFKLKPRHRIFLHGAPGNGKTMLAEAMAHELGVPFLRVKYGGLIDSHLGETAKNIDTMMEYASSAPCVLFADEFDGIGMDRSDNQDVGEARRITNQLLIALERMPAHCVFIAATNAPTLMDKALIRRFDFVVEVKQPTPELIHRCALKELDPSITPGHDLRHLAKKIQTMPVVNIYSVVELCKRIRRDLVINDGKRMAAILSEVSENINC
jgi:SpoVK/Ycf46/Vps4 family AAA+-type ATPase